MKNAWSDAVERGRKVETSAIADELDAQLADLKDGDPGGLTPGVKWCRARLRPGAGDRGRPEVGGRRGDGLALGLGGVDGPRGS